MKKCQTKTLYTKRSIKNCRHLRGLPPPPQPQFGQFVASAVKCRLLQECNWCFNAICHLISPRDYFMTNNTSTIPPPRTSKWDSSYLTFMAVHFWGQWQKPILIWVKINAVIPLKKSAKQFSHEQFTAQTCQSICVWNSWHVVLQTSPYQGLNTISTFPDYRAAAEDYVNYHVPMCDVRRRGIRESWRLSIIKYNSYNLTSHRK